jgi:TonB family protein
MMETAYFTASIPGKDVSVSLSANVLERLRRELGKSDAASSSRGLLLGNRSPGSDCLFIADCFPIALRSPGSSQAPGNESINAKLLKQALNLWKPGSRTALYAVGQYSVALRTPRGNGNVIEFDGLSEGDLFLKVTGKGSATSAAFYMIDADGQSSAHPDLTLPFDSLVPGDEPTGSEEQPGEPSNTPAEPVSSGRSTDSRFHVSAGTAWWRMWPAWVIAGLVVTIAGLLFQQSRATSLRNQKAQTTELRLEPVRTGSQWELRWDKDAPAVRAAKRAQLTVSDGSRFTQLDLDASEIQHGYVLYTPESSDVTFRLDMYDPSGRALTESVRALANVAGDHADIESRSYQSRDARKSESPSTGVRSPEPRATANLARSVPTVSRKDQEFRSNQLATAQLTPAAGRTNPSPAVRQTAGSSADQTTRRNTVLPNATDKPNSESGGNPGAPKAKRADATMPRLPAPAPPRTWSAALAKAETPAYVPPQPLQKPAPVFRKVGALSYAATDVDIVVHVDQNGRVSNARLASNSGFITGPLAAAALDAARRWIFEPAKSHGNRIESDYKIVFRFVPPSQ